ncbi:NAD-dependent epimerase/dehydratase family protein [Agromyces sp. MMS24-JH15]|uniref:NAD-dependent epimerase/dehydratase family protein n=1 Tax=Agromyces sp. MMS24-JH15 TaxID=3243765 RepID=UPI003747DEEC
MNPGTTPLSVLYLGGTGTISASCVRRSVAAGMQVAVLNRGRNQRGRDLPAEVELLTGDITDDASVVAALGDRRFDAVVNFLSYGAEDAARMADLFTGRTRQYVYISSASIYRKPVLQTPIVESAARSNPYLQYARDKLAAEDVLMRRFADDGFPVTIVRPSHTYDEANPPLPGDWTIVDRIARGDEIVVHGDGTSLWTLTHADDLAQGLVGLLGDQRAVGEAFHITSDEVYTWNQIYTLIADALGVEARLVHVPSEFYPLAAPDWFWSDLILGDLAHSAVFDNAKIRRYVPGFAPVVPFHRAARQMVRWRAEHPVETGPDPVVEGYVDRLLRGYHVSREAFAALAPEPSVDEADAA